MKATMRNILHLPATRPGKWSVGLIITMPVLILLGLLSMNLFYPSVPSGDTILEDLLARPALALFMLAGMFCGVMAFFTGFTAVIKQKDRSLFVYFSTIIGGMLVFFLLGELISPH
jgi:hypothetical protein